MNTNVVKFPKIAKTTNMFRNSDAVEMLKDNVVQLKEWRARAQYRRTSRGVFVTSNVLGTAGGIA